MTFVHKTEIVPCPIGKINQFVFAENRADNL